MAKPKKTKLAHWLQYRLISLTYDLTIKKVCRMIRIAHDQHSQRGYVLPGVKEWKNSLNDSIHDLDKKDIVLEVANHFNEEWEEIDNGNTKKD